MGESFVIHEGDCRDVLRTLPSESIDACVTDPPYELGFMGKKWDGTGIANDIEVWREVLRVLKPGAHLLAFGGTRTYHRMVCAIEDAGFEIRDQIGWLYGSGFPKSHDVSKAIDKAAGTEHLREFKCVNPADRPGNSGSGVDDGSTAKTSNGWRKPVRPDKTHSYTDAAKQWEGWGTALKPAWEPIVMARKPLIGTVAENVQEHGTGAINVDGCRVSIDETLPSYRKHGSGQVGSGGVYQGGYVGTPTVITNEHPESVRHNAAGRWPANIIHDGSEEVMAEFAKNGTTTSGAMKREVSGYGADSMFLNGRSGPSNQHGDTGTAARFFYCAKASQSDRNEGLNGFETKVKDAEYRQPTGNAMVDRIHGCGVKRANHHPTVKPTALMRYLCRLVTPSDGIVLDCFTGSGSTGRGALLEGFQFIGIEQDAEYIAIAKARIEAALGSVNLDEPLDLFAHVG